MRQKIVLSKGMKILTIILLVVLIIAIVYLFHVGIPFNKEQGGLFDACTAIVLCMALIISFALAPKAIELTDTKIIIHRNIGNKTIYLKDVNSLEPYDPKSLDIRIFGSGGFFGSFGIFRNSDYGLYTAYVGDYKEAFYIILDTGKACLVSCENRDEMMRGITAIISKTNH